MTIVLELSADACWQGRLELAAVRVDLPSGCPAKGDLRFQGALARLKRAGEGFQRFVGALGNLYHAVVAVAEIGAVFKLADDCRP